MMVVHVELRETSDVVESFSDAMILVKMFDVDLSDIKVSFCVIDESLSSIVIGVTPLTTDSTK